MSPRILDHRFKFTYSVSDVSDGRTCIERADEVAAAKASASLLWGEVSPEGVTKMFDPSHLQVEKKIKEKCFSCWFLKNE